MLESFEVASGTVAGSMHAGANNQDGFACRWNERAIVGVVCDGCSSAPHSEVGAKLGARIVAEQLLSRLAGLPEPIVPEAMGEALEGTRLKTVSSLRSLSRAMGPRVADMAAQYFLFTTVGFAVGRSVSFTFSIGDGVLAVNGELMQIGPFAGNAPPYLAYGGLVPSSLDSSDPQLLRFRIHHVIPTERLRSVLVGTDGMEQARLAAGRSLPGLAEPFGPISQFWTEDRYFKNPLSVSRRLAQANRRVTRMDVASGSCWEESCLLPDDTTLLVARRRLPAG